MRPIPTAGLLGFFALAAGLGGCGDSGSPRQGGSAPADTRGVIVSAGDCVSFGPDAVKACAAAIERAVTAHEASSTPYGNIQACESALGESRCERVASGKYRARLSAFMVTVGDSSARAEPLYPVKDGGVGFQTASAGKLMANDSSLTFSRLALSVAETQAAQGKKGRRQKVF